MELPRPYYTRVASNTQGHGEIKWIGLHNRSEDGTAKEYLWWQNFLLGDFRNAKTRDSVAAFLAHLKLDMNVEAVIGYPIDLSHSDPTADYVSLLQTPGLYGVYIEAAKRPLFTYRFGISDRRPGTTSSRHADFENVFRRLRASLPDHSM